MKWDLKRWDFVCAIQCFVVSTIGLSLFAYVRGQDINYDLMNYHHFSPFAFLSKNPFQDITIQQQFLNPILYLPHYVLNSLFSPKIATLFIVLFQAINIPLIYLLSACLLKPYSAPWKTEGVVLLCATAIAFSSPLFLTEVGTSFADGITSIFIISSICLLVLSLNSAKHQAFAWPLAAGICMGAAFGLKLTNGVFALAAAASLSLVKLRSRIVRLVAFTVGGLLGVLVTGGYWHFLLYKKFGNPIFPFYNNIFKSPFYPPNAIVDDRFIPNSIVSAASYPFQWAWGISPSSELPFRDLRFAFLFIAVLILCFVGLLALGGRPQVFGKRAPIAAGGRHGAIFLLLFAVASFVLWISLFAIQRYLIPLELMAGSCLIAVAVVLGVGIRAIMLTGIAVTVAICAWSRPIDFGHSQWVDRVARTELPKDILESNALFLLYGWPTTYLIPDFGPRAQFFDIYMLDDPKNAMAQTFSHILATEKRAIYSINNDRLSAHTLKFLNNFGLRQDGIDCPYFESAIGARKVGHSLCRLYHSDTGAMTTAATYPVGRTIVFGRPGRNSVFYETSGWGIENDTGRAWDPSANELHLRLETMQKPPKHLVLNFSLIVPPGQCDFDITVNGTSVFKARNTEDCGDGKLEIAVPTGVVDLDRLLDIVFVRFASTSSANEPIVIQNFNIRSP
jgi:hypothetical protein